MVDRRVHDSGRYRHVAGGQTVIVFWSMLAGAVIMLIGILFGVAITDINNRRTKSKEDQ